ncbi:hypothetical protein BDA96_06G039900 [Sorghum bicolor]|uniref:KIB1-4 beta-propeller domain-containing protein n=1 Tax=Sorghum bicolor TaxID=4558 RepID=A0A921UB85_SORBI|nr:hypothetical protein BDA96_06G039900 [Sorghum bicolor]
MAGSPLRRRRRGARSSQQGAESSPLEEGTLSTREVTIVEKSGSTSSGPYVCADLLDSLLHEIIVLINSFQDFLAFTGTCHSWRAAVSSFPSVYAFSFPPLHLKPDGPYVPPHSRVPQNTPNEMDYLGCSHGYFIFTYEEHCLLVDAYTGAKVMPPKLPCNNNIDYYPYIGVLTAPFSSPNSCLLLFSMASIFEWQVGTNSWSEHPLHLDHERIYQVVFFEGHILVTDTLMRLHTIQLTPQFSMKRIAVTWSSLRALPLNPWLVVCGDMLLMVDLAISFGYLMMLILKRLGLRWRLVSHFPTTVYLTP